jgi:hypothetical protein
MRHTVTTTATHCSACGELKPFPAAVNPYAEDGLRGLRLTHVCLAVSNELDGNQAQPLRKAIRALFPNLQSGRTSNLLVNTTR